MRTWPVLGRVKCKDCDALRDNIAGEVRTRSATSAGHRWPHSLTTTVMPARRGRVRTVQAARLNRGKGTKGDFNMNKITLARAISVTCVALSGSALGLACGSASGGHHQAAAPAQRQTCWWSGRDAYGYVYARVTEARPHLACDPQVNLITSTGTLTPVTTPGTGRQFRTIRVLRRCAST